MADIPVERQSSGAWWKWLLGLVLLALAIWLVASLVDAGGDEMGAATDEPAQQPTERPAGEAAPGGAEGPITSLAAITTTGGQQDVAGRDVQLSNLNVTSVVGDGAFYVSDGANEQVLVVVDEGTQMETGAAGGGDAQEGAGAATDQQVNVSEGQTIGTLEGAVEQMNETALSEWGLDNTEAAGEAVYIQAERISFRGAAG